MKQQFSKCRYFTNPLHVSGNYELYHCMRISQDYELLIWSLVLFATVITLYKWTYRAYKKRRAILHNGVKTKAKIIQYDRIEMGEDPDKAVLYRCYLEFTNKAEESFIVRTEEDQPYKYPTGTELTVYYLESDPNQFIIKETLPYQTKLLPLGIIIILTCLYNIMILTGHLTKD